MQHAPGFLRLVEAARRRIREVSIDEVRAMSQAAEAFHLVDVREQDEWGRGHLPGARHLGKGIIERDIEATIPDRDAPIVLYCGGGYRSALAADALRADGIHPRRVDVGRLACLDRGRISGQPGRVTDWRQPPAIASARGWRRSGYSRTAGSGRRRRRCRRAR